MHFTFLLSAHLAAAIPLVDFLLDEIPDLSLQTSSASSDLFSVSADSDLFSEAENAADFLLTDTSFCLSDENDDFLSTSKLRIRDSCLSTDPDASLTIPTFNQASPGLKVIERARLNKLFRVGSPIRLKNIDGKDLCPLETTFGSMIPVCDSGSWADAVREAGGDYTLFHIRPYIPLLPCQDPSFLWCCAYIDYFKPPTVSSLLDPLLDFSQDVSPTGPILPVGYVCYNPSGEPINRSRERIFTPGPPKA